MGGKCSNARKPEKHCTGEKACVGSHETLRAAAAKTKDWLKVVETATKQDAKSTVLYEEYQGLLAGAGAEYATLGKGFGPNDCLLIIDMQNDFIPKLHAPLGGRFGVAEGASAQVPITEMVRKAAAAKALIATTRDYHPKDHCSFMENQGPFPCHCLQGSPGSFFYPPTKEVLKEVRDQGAEVVVAFKGFHPRCDSFGGLPYGDSYFVERALGNATGTTPDDTFWDFCALDWTGSFVLTCANLQEDLDAPPDVLAVLDRKAIGDLLQERKVERLFVCGLALDFCVLDSSLNAATLGLAPEGIFLVVDAARAAYIPEIGTFGSGFLSDPASVVKKVNAAGVKLIKSDAI